MATRTSSRTATTTKTSSRLQYSDVVKSAGGVAQNRQTGAMTYSKSAAPKGGGNFAVRGDNSELIQDVDPSKAPASGGVPNYGGLAPTPTTQPIENAAPIQQPETPTQGAITPQEGLNKALESGTPPPQDAGEARSQIQQYQPQAANTFYKPSEGSDQVYNAKGQKLSYDDFIAQGGKADFSNVQAGLPQNAALNNQLEVDPGYQALLQARKEYNDVSNQRMSLTEEYDQISKKLGIDSINTELMNMKNVIEGSEDDLRTEITKAGGFATESQVQALTMARNKQLVKNYNNLLETKQMAMETLNTMIGLAAQDRQYAQQVALQKFQIETQVIEYKDKMKQNAANTLFKIAETYGYGALASGDPWQDALTEKTLGLPSGGLAQLGTMKTMQQQQFEAQMAQSQSQFDKRLFLDSMQFNWDISSKNPKNIAQGQDAPNVVDLGNGIKGTWNPNTQKFEPININQQQDPVQQAMSRDKISQFEKVYSDLEKPSTVGVGTGGWRDFFTNPFSGKKTDFIANVEQIKGQIVGKTLGDMKAQGATFGALSDAELALVQQAASKISTWEQKDKNGKVTGYSVSPDAMRAEIKKLSSYAKLSYLKSGGSPEDIGIPRQPDSKYFLDVGGKMINVTPGTFNSAGNASASVKGTQQKGSFMPQLSTGVEGKKVPLVQAYPQGSSGGQCGVWVRDIVEKQGLTYPAVGNSLAEKANTAKKYGVPMSQAKQGSVILTSENKTYGHVAYITGRNEQGFIVGESNYGMNGKVSYGRVIPYNSPAILGILNPK